MVRAGHLADQSLIARRIGELQFVTCAAPAYIARQGEPRQPADLEQRHRVVGYFRASERPFAFAFRSADGEVEVNGRYIVAVNDGNAYVQAALSGLGVIQTPRFTVERHLQSGELRPVLTAWTRDPLPSISSIRPTATSATSCAPSSIGSPICSPDTSLFAGARRVRPKVNDWQCPAVGQRRSSRPRQPNVS